MSQIEWNSGEAISAVASLSGEDKYLRVSYSITKEEVKTDYDYKIELTTIPANLGGGEIIYFVCPQTGKRCKVLYRAYGSPIWKAKQAYTLPIYYPIQVKPKWQYYHDQRERYKAEASELAEQLNPNRSNPTKKHLRLNRLKEKIAHHDRKFREHIPKSVLAGFGEIGLNPDWI